MIKITEIVRQKLINKFDVRVGVSNQSIESRINEANNWGANAYVAIHSNAGGGRGCEVFAYSKTAKGAELAKAIYAKMESITPSSDRGVKYNENFYELNSTIAPACLVEIAFHDNAEDANWIINNRDLIGTEIAKGIYDYFKIEYEEEKEKNEIQKIQEKLNKKYGSNLVEDGIFGPETKKALVRALQIELNTQFGSNLEVDGIFGQNTKNACINVGFGAEGKITWLIQAMLVCRGYHIEVDGIFGYKTKEAIIDFQRKSGLVADGICGANTFEKLFN